MFQINGAAPQPPDNQQAARAVFAVASLLESQGANPYRVRAYRRAAVAMLRLQVRARRFTSPDGHLLLPGLGPRLQFKLGELVTRGRMSFHQQLLAELPLPLRDLLLVPGIGPRTAQRLLAELGVTSLDDLVRAGENGRLRTLRGIGSAREADFVAGARAILAQRDTHMLPVAA